MRLLPTPTAGVFNDSESVESWTARAARLKEKHGNGNGAGMPLPVAIKLSVQEKATTLHEHTTAPDPGCSTGPRRPSVEGRGEEGRAAAPWPAEAPRIGSLCTGVGGLERALSALWPDAEPAWYSEIDPAACTVLAHHHPGVKNLGDLKSVSWGHVDRVDILTAGYPCQPFSQAGRKLGHEDPRHLWPWIADAVRDLRPRLVVLENVRGHVRRGLGTVVEDLADLGYVSRWGCVQAAGVGAPHRRERVFIVAVPDGEPGFQRWQPADGEAPGRGARPGAGRPVGVGDPGGAAPDGEGSPEQDERAAGGVEAPLGDHPVRRLLGAYEPAVQRWEALTRPAPDPLDERGRLNHWFVEWMMGFPEGHVCDHVARKDALRLLGNAVVSQQAVLALSLLLGDDG